MTSAAAPARPAWLTEPDELPHRSPGWDHWSENYLSYVFSPDTRVGIWMHLCRVEGANGLPSLWDEAIYICLPGDRFVVARGFTGGHLESSGDGLSRGIGELTVAGLSFRCDEPFARWTKRFRGAGRLASGDELRAGPLADGMHVPVSFDLDATMMSPAFDYGQENLEQSWAKAHYEQQQRVTGRLHLPGETHEIDGTGLRDHSWGSRDWTKLGSHAWIHGQFPDSGRSFMIAYVSEHPDYPEPLSSTVVSDGVTVEQATAVDVPIAANLAGTERDAEFGIVMPDGRSTTVHAELLVPMRMHLTSYTEFSAGTTLRRGVPHPSHDYVPAYARLTWDGEVGNGYVERTAKLT